LDRFPFCWPRLHTQHRSEQVRVTFSKPGGKGGRDGTVRWSGSFDIRLHTCQYGRAIYVCGCMMMAMDVGETGEGRCGELGSWTFVACGVRKVLVDIGQGHIHSYMHACSKDTWISMKCVTGPPLNGRLDEGSVSYGNAFAALLQ